MSSSPWLSFKIQPFRSRFPLTMSFLHPASLLHPSHHPSSFLYALANTTIDRHIIG